jgi:hypothetical protein
MKNKVKFFKAIRSIAAMRSIAIIALAAILVFSMVACSGSGGGKTLNSPEALKEYLDKQPANSPDKPIRVSMAINEPMINSVAKVISSSGKYVSLNITGNLLTTIPENAFLVSNEKGCVTLVSITIPNSVTEIGWGAFAICTSLTSVTIPNSVTAIGNYAFYNCTSLASVTIPNSVTTIGERAFAGNRFSKLTSVTIGNSVTTIGERAFEFNQLTRVTIPNSVTEIGRWAFYNNNQLTSVTIGTNVDIKEPAFWSDDVNSGYFISIGFENAYDNNGKAAGTYTRPNTGSTAWTKQ